jgi:imidazolonepropionase-like amidohydrolase
LERADKIGVKLAFGTDAIWVDPKRTRGEVMIDFIEAYKAAGVSNLKTVQAMTVNAAQLLGVAADRGRLTVGTYADLVIVPSNPLQDLDALRTPLLVMKEGAVVFERDAAIQAARSSAVR